MCMCSAPGALDSQRLQRCTEQVRLCVSRLTLTLTFTLTLTLILTLTLNPTPTPTHTLTRIALSCMRARRQSGERVRSLPPRSGRASSLQHSVSRWGLQGGAGRLFAEGGAGSGQRGLGRLWSFHPSERGGPCWGQNTYIIHYTHQPRRPPPDFSCHPSPTHYSLALSCTMPRLR